MNRRCQDRENCFEIVRFAIALHTEIPPEAIEELDRLDRDLGLAPLDLVQVALHLEELGDSEFPVADLEGASSVGDFVDIVRAWCDVDAAAGAAATGPPTVRSASVTDEMPATIRTRAC